MLIIHQWPSFAVLVNHFTSFTTIRSSDPLFHNLVCSIRSLISYCYIASARHGSIFASHFVFYLIFLLKKKQNRSASPPNFHFLRKSGVKTTRSGNKLPSLDLFLLLLMAPLKRSTKQVANNPIIVNGCFATYNNWLVSSTCSHLLEKGAAKI